MYAAVLIRRVSVLGEIYVIGTHDVPLWGTPNDCFFLVCVCVWGGGGGGEGGLQPLSRIFHFNIELIVHQRCAKTGEPGKEPPDHP